MFASRKHLNVGVKALLPSRGFKDFLLTLYLAFLYPIIKKKIH